MYTSIQVYYCITGFFYRRIFEFIHLFIPDPMHTNKFEGEKVSRVAKTIVHYITGLVFQNI